MHHSKNFSIVINNRDLVTWPRAMATSFEKMIGVQEIIIVDNNSSYEPLLQWYSETKYKIVRLGKNVGHTAPWVPEVKEHIKTDFYAVSDPDLCLKNLPADTLVHLAMILVCNPALEKIGVSLDLPEKMGVSYCWEKSYSRFPVLNGLYREAFIDTTLAIYHKRVLNEYKVCGARAIRPYTARHLPWVKDAREAISDEYRYYLQNASMSSSEKRIRSLEV